MQNHLLIQVDSSKIEQHFSVLSQIGRLGMSPESGYLRASWSYEESEAMAYIRQVGIENGLTAHYDGVGNLFLTTPYHKPTLLQMGSHLDTVPMGGNYDGAAGVVIGLEAILALKDHWQELEHALQLIAWRGEESATFGALCKGSQAAFGKNDPKILRKEFEGNTLEDAILSQGYNPAYISEQKPTLSQAQMDAIQAHIEVHIEQAKSLEVNNLNIGIVSSIRGAVRFRAIVEGEAAHSGGTPMGVEYRQDANLAIAYMQVALDKRVQEALATGDDLVLTVGLLNSDFNYNLHDPRVYENALTKVSPFGYFAVDIRSNRAETLARIVADAKQIIEQVARDFRVSVTFQSITELAPTETLDERIQEAVYESCRSLGLKSVVMSSGALHDVAVVANQRRSDGSRIPSGLIFIPCKEGISHNPKEYASPEALTNGARVLAQTLYRLGRGS